MENKMKIQKTVGKYEVRFDNSHLCGTIEWDAMWSEWRFIPTGRFSVGYLKDIVKFMEKLK